jgi:L-alanine-DL-glutamate epimerase-like enolase superfamily enzyme
MTQVRAYRIPTATPESDGTFEWDSTTLVVVHIDNGVGYTYANAATAAMIRDLLDVLEPDEIEKSWAAMIRAVRNVGRRGIAAMAISAIDAALWDRKAKSLGCSLAGLLGRVRNGAPVYGSGGFTSYSTDQLSDQLGGWVRDGIPRVKMKIGRDAAADRERVRIARKVIGDDAELFVDANGAYTRKQAIEQARTFEEQRVTWFEEPVSSDDLDGLQFIRERTNIEVAAGEYGYELQYFAEMIPHVDVLQADATRCLGITGFVKTAALCEANNIQLSAHCAPSLHMHLGCALLPVRHLEYFFDHARIESMLFDGFIAPRNGEIHPDVSRPGLGIELKEKDAEKYRI